MMAASYFPKQSRGAASFQIILNVVFFAIIAILFFSVDAVSYNLASSSSASQSSSLSLVDTYINDFMSTPTEVIGRAQTFLRIGGFPALSSGSSFERSLANPTIESKWAFTESPIRFYFGREDGSFLIYRPMRTLVYMWRDPGDSGYETEPFVTEENQKHWSSCLDENGNATNCTLPKDSLYIRCIDKCEMELCAVDDENDNNRTGKSNSEEDKWCRKYSIETVLPGEKLGRVPAYLSCVNEFGARTQTQEKVLQNVTDGEVGNCYYDDGTTLVNGTGDTVGVHRTLIFDPRYRDWYTSSKQRQRPLWSDPYIFASMGEIGITYAEPFYTQQGEMRNVFDGVFAVDYTLEEISTFLKERFYSSDILVAVIEASEPHYVVAVSTGSNVTTKQCQVQQNSADLCTLLRITIDDLSDRNQDPGDEVLSRAFEEESMAGFPDYLVAFKESDDMGTNAFISQSSVVESANLKWRIIVVIPMERDKSDAVRHGTKMYVAIVTTSIIGSLICMALCYLFFSYRQNRKVQNADYRFTCAFLFGNGLVNLSSLAYLGENTDELCMLRLWAFNLTVVITLSPLFVKIWRMYRLIQASSHFKRIIITNARAILYTLPIIGSEIVILTILSLVDPPRADENFGDEDNVQFEQLQSTCCQYKTNAIRITLAIFNSLLVCIGCFLAYKSRNIDQRFGEARELGFVMYNTACMEILLLIFITFFSPNEATTRVVNTIAIAFWTIVNSLIFVVPTMMGIRDLQRKDAGRKQILQNMKFVEDGGSEYLVSASNTSAQVSNPKSASDALASVDDSQQKAIETSSLKDRIEEKESEQEET